MTTYKDTEMAALDALLADAARHPIDVPDPLMARVLADAEAQLPKRIAPMRRSLWERITESLGGWQGMGGLVAATCAGFWIGVSPPEAFVDPSALIFGTEYSAEYDDTAELSGFGWDLEEG